MKKFGVAVVGILAAISGGTVQKMIDECEQSAEICENLAESASWQRKMLFGMLNPNYLDDVLAEIEQAKDGGDLSAAIHFWELEPYREAIEGEFNRWAHIRDTRPFAVYTFGDDSGQGLVLYKSGWAYQVGSRVGNGLVTHISQEAMTITKDETGEEKIVHFQGLYLSGRVVDSDGLGFKMTPRPSMEEILKGWKKRR